MARIVIPQSTRIVDGRLLVEFTLVERSVAGDIGLAAGQCEMAISLAAAQKRNALKAAAQQIAPPNMVETPLPEVEL